ncbi:MAG: hypothetical protein AB8B92_10375 [Gammaproteobacteria bacterium]
MKILITTLLVLSISTAVLMTATVYATDKEYEHMQEMNEHMEIMEAQMQAIHAENNLDEREKLMQAHRNTIREGMKMMMEDEDGKGKMGKMKEEIHKAMKGEEKTDVHARMGNMEEHIDMMQQMMEQMMHHQNELYDLYQEYRDFNRDLGS